ncbi:MAG: acetyl-CoA carboxylase carboxyl transferase subunit alpha [Candidatus Omnitrophica bacterium CG11_big_fil_rev_8_21_14_0_20_45_26]|uniref:Acetyl-coenzyme A carboxylase carboxyl transferase subunit alpha n=1 Tax=Candidatus Abzuiibacterium crystallinum TaxID=1974748 RepID=A0A2H0LMC5_9BACT|nr:MAG: acetyl-CoA carboxylase carboxyl transferase subunit alpha [Candidatus Omnitrophica bacterium CG11_big_fil_rev_8_21_14_0_20_45_26]PIW63667.1 MAG: acetyl-CoA carboxylase carboxyl transferase subunit alpha [Candidatus Omnitrophica bacterium CG12_big_fil_rev_8_21_14_0_65_45_16]
MAAKKKKRSKSVSQKREKIKITEKDTTEVYLPFEKPIVELENMLKEMRSKKEIDLSEEIKSAEKKLEVMIRKTYEHLTPWQRVQVARHPLRPFMLDYVRYLIEDFLEIHGDRHFSDDKAMVCGFGKFNGRKVCVIGHQKGRDTKENLMRSFGSAHPEGYRKAIRIMRLAEKFHIPIVTFIDTPGAYPGIGAEERGQAEAIAYNLREMMELTVPIVTIVIGEGGSGGALGIGVANDVLMLENAYYSVISPEGCAAILWKDSARAADASEALKMTAEDLLEFKVIDKIIKEPLGGAHRDFETTAKELAKALEASLKSLEDLSEKELVETRYEKFREMGVFQE